MPDDLSDLRKKTHIDHSIRLVKHKNFYVSEVDRASLDQIVQPSGCRDQDVNTCSERFDLSRKTLAADHCYGAKRGGPAVDFRSCFYLNCKLACWSKHKRSRNAASAKSLNDRQQKSQGLA